MQPFELPLLLGGPDSFADGKYDRTPVGELMPLYLNFSAPTPASDEGELEYRLALTREGVYHTVGGRTPSMQRVALGADAQGRLTALIHTSVSRRMA